MTLYRDILRQAIKTSWQHKYLWFFGLFAALLGNGGELELIFQRFDNTVEQGLFPGLARVWSTGIFSKSALINIGDLASRDPLSLFLLLSVLILMLVFAGFVIWLTIVSQAALVNNTARARIGKKHNFKNGLEVGTRKFFSVLGLNALLKGIIYVVFILLSLPIIVNINNSFFGASSLLFITSFIIFIPIAIILSFIIKYAIASCVIKGSKFLDSIKLGWQLFLRNWLISIEMAFLLFFINLLVGILLLLVLLVLTVPFLFLAFVLSQLAFYFNFWHIVVSAMILYIGIIMVVGSWLATFQTASWTGLYLELISKGGVSKLTRVFNKE